MLHLSLNAKDYILIGDSIKVHYNKNDGAYTISMGVDAPRSMTIVRGQIYEQQLLDLAENGDLEAAEELRQIEAERINRRKQSNVRRQRQRFHHLEGTET